MENTADGAFLGRKEPDPGRGEAEGVWGGHAQQWVWGSFGRKRG